MGLTRIPDGGLALSLRGCPGGLIHRQVQERKYIGIKLLSRPQTSTCVKLWISIGKSLYHSNFSVADFVAPLPVSRPTRIKPVSSMPETHLDALVVGTGFSGIYELYALRKLGLKCLAIDTAGGLGGTWFWNRYPGAMSDSPSVVYRYAFDKEELRTYPWPNNYVVQHEILAYLTHFADKHGLREHMQFNTELISAEWDEASKRWIARCSQGKVFVVRYLIPALGQLSKQNMPDIPGVERKDLKVKVVHTSSWDESLDVRGKRKNNIIAITF